MCSRRGDFRENLAPSMPWGGGLPGIHPASELPRHAQFAERHSIILSLAYICMCMHYISRHALSIFMYAHAFSCRSDGACRDGCQGHGAVKPAEGSTDLVFRNPETGRCNSVETGRGRIIHRRAVGLRPRNSVRRRDRRHVPTGRHPTRSKPDGTRLNCCTRKSMKTRIFGARC